MKYSAQEPDLAMSTSLLLLLECCIFGVAYYLLGSAHFCNKFYNIDTWCYATYYSSSMLVG